MKIADGPVATSQVHVFAPPAVVWRLVIDINTPAFFSPEFYEAEWLDGATGPALGARFVGRNRRTGIGHWETQAQVCQLEPERVFSWRVTGIGGDFNRPLATWAFELGPDEGGTRLYQWVRIGPGRSWLSRAISGMPHAEEALVARRLNDLAAAMTTTLNGIKFLAEWSVAEG